MINVSLSTIPTIPDIRPKDDLALIIGNALESHGVESGDILCIAHKIISKAEGAIFNLEEIEPSTEALEYAEKLNKNPKKVYSTFLKESFSQNFDNKIEFIEFKYLNDQNMIWDKIEIKFNIGKFPISFRIPRNFYLKSK